MCTQKGYNTKRPTALISAPMVTTDFCFQVKLFYFSLNLQILFSEQLIVSTTSDFRYQHIMAPKNRDGIVFEIQAKKSAHILLSQERKPTTMMYQIVLGDLDNTISWIGRGKHGKKIYNI